ncbi:MAG: hypothetical protein ACJA08_001232 [Cyclobacteriaceae bacterium]|jgi:hypothetical protein
MILIAVVVFNLLTGDSRPAIILFIIGGFFLIQRQTDIDFLTYWPAILVLIGLSFLIRGKSSSSNSSSEGFFDGLNTLSASKKKFTSNPFQGCRITNIFGGFSDKRNVTVLSNPVHVTIKGIMIFGAGDLKSR